MSRLPRLRAAELIKALDVRALRLSALAAATNRLKYPDGRVTTVPVHAGEEIGTGLLKSILRQCELTMED